MIPVGIIPTCGRCTPRGGISPEIAVPPWPQFLRGCIRHRQSPDRQAPDAPVPNRAFEGTAGEG